MEIKLTKRELDILILAEATRRAEERGLRVLKATRMRTRWTLSASTEALAKAAADGGITLDGAVVVIDED